MLQLAAAAGIHGVVGTAGSDPSGPGLDQPGDPAPGKSRLGAELAKLDQIPWRGAGDKYGSTIVKPTDAIAARRDTLDPDQRSPSVRAARRQREFA